MEKNIIKKYNNFLSEGKREQAKIDELLDILSSRKLTDTEKDLLDRLIKGESLPEPVMKKHKTGGGYMFDENGKVIMENDPEEDAGKEFLTSRGKQKTPAPKKDDVIDARVYRNRNSEERFFFIYVTNDIETPVSTWIIFRTGSDRFPFGQIMDVRSPKFADFINKQPAQLWKELDYDFDFGMVLDNELYEDVIEYVDLFKDNQIKYKNRLIELKNKFLKLL